MGNANLLMYRRPPNISTGTHDQAVRNLCRRDSFWYEGTDIYVSFHCYPAR